ncbi:MAG: twin-arginine translocation protein TatB subunit [Mycobacterium sp.]|nr:twin-arginine translocation protein TatB subunit [Mycobacterium sp.]
MFGMSPWHIAVLVVVALVVFGPDRLPGMIKELGKALRQVRATALTMQDDLKSELGPEVGDLDLRSLHPRTFVEKHLFGEEDLDVLRKVAEPLTSLDKPEPAVSASVADPIQQSAPEAESVAPEPLSMQKPAQVRFDADAT